MPDKYKVIGAVLLVFLALQAAHIVIDMLITAATLGLLYLVVKHYYSSG